jgi:N-6 DNA Methylase
MKASLDQWLERLGYDGSVGVIHRPGQGLRADHSFAREIELLMQPERGIVASAVFEVDRVPAVCFLEADADAPLDAEFVSRVRGKIWNQNLVSILIVTRGDEATAYPAPKALSPVAPLAFATARPDGHFSAAEVADGSIYAKLPNWFDRKYRVDSSLQKNLAKGVELLGNELTVAQAQLLLGKCIFVSYLQDREIVSNRYREMHGLGTLLDLLTAADGKSLDSFFGQLKDHFNGDLLEVSGGDNVAWSSLGPQAFDVLRDFLLQTRLRDGQTSLWPYDFKFIPVELLSGIYESFLGEGERKKGAVYTPHNLAALSVDEVFRDIAEPWNEVVLDGACGSGILLTSAYRRMLSAKRAAQSRALSYAQRKKILLSGIRGGDISSAATKVTAFSLYLALLEDLTPSDLMLLQDDPEVKLPRLVGEILADEVADFFHSDNKIARPMSATIVISNPPWSEPAKADTDHRYETWWVERSKLPLPYRQIALAFARRATEALKPGGRLCLILPVLVLGGDGAAPYLREWFRELEPQRVFNFADMRRVLFDGAKHPTAVVVGRRRPLHEVGRIPPAETFQYLAPKCDISLAFGRLTVHSYDRKQLMTHAVINDSEMLRTYFWGNELDESLVARLRLNGTLGDRADGTEARFVICKGFHLSDKNKDPIESSPLHKYRFLSTERGKSRLPTDRLFIAKSDLVSFPESIPEVADYGSRGGRAFDGVRVIFPDGADDKTLEVRACYADHPFCFTQTVGAIVDERGDAELMRFLAAYLRSKLVRYLIFCTAFSATMERPHIKLTEIKGLPFLLPNEHTQPKRASQIVAEVAAALKAVEHTDTLSAYGPATAMRNRLDELIFEYFGLSGTERQVVLETCDYLIPIRQCSELSKMSGVLQKVPHAAEVTEYERVLQSELELWRDRLKGSGAFEVRVLPSSFCKAGAMSVVRISFSDTNEVPSSVETVLNGLRGREDFPIAGTETLSMASDFLVFHDGDYFLVKPMVRRLWLASAAAHDAYRIVKSARSPQTH